jgi:glycosyltransferase involved in cell wall biosynthesis
LKIILSRHGGSDRSEGIHFERVLKRMGHDVFTVSVPSRESELDKVDTFVGYAPRTRVEELQKQFGLSDLFLYVEPVGLIPTGMERAPFVTAAVLCDMHQNLASRLQLGRFFDHLFLYQRNYVSAFTEHAKDHVHWMPFACDTESVFPLDLPRDLDVAFVGKLINPEHERSRIVTEIGRRWKLNPQHYYPQAGIPSIYSRAKIVLNLPLKDDLNFRTFEAMSCGALLLTRRIANGQEALFEEGRHYAAFSSQAELMDKISYYLAHDRERKEIAAAGLREVRAKHTLRLRLEQLLGTVRAKPQLVAPVRRMRSSQVDRCYAKLYEQWSDVGAGLQLVREAKKQGRSWPGLTIPVLRSALRTVFR